MCVVIGGAVYGQDFGFGDDDAGGGTGGGGKALNVSIGGEVSGSFVGYFYDFYYRSITPVLGDVFSGKLNFSMSTSIVEGVINLKLSPSVSPVSIPPDSPVSIDEGYVRAYLGNFDITAGLRKLTWGKADSFGPLDVINPLDYSGVFIEMADSVSLAAIKITRPLVHASFRFGQFSKIEGVFVPWFEPHYIPEEGKWAPAQRQMLTNPPIEIPPGMTIEKAEPDIKALDHAQAGLRFTTTVGSADIGAQYYYGRLPQPTVKKVDITSNPIMVNLLYNPYHQIGLDYAQVLFGFNIRAELAANITYDLKGDDATVYNPSIAWSFGFDRDLVWGINLNLQVNESMRLMHDRLGSDNFLHATTGDFDIESGLPLTSTRLIASVSKKFLRDELELRAAVVWGMEDKDAVIMPALIWTKNDIRIALSGGFFLGDKNKEGQLSQFRDNHFFKISMTYTF
jgi:hypothetical protein